MGRYISYAIRVILTGVAAVLGFSLNSCSFQKLQELRTLERVPRSETAAVIPGEVNLEGTVQAVGDHGLLQGPDSNAPCVYYHFVLERKRKNSNGGSNWDTVRTETRSLPFDLVDSSGAIRVDPDGRVKFDAPYRHSRTEGDLRYSERRIDPGQNVFVFGYAEMFTTQPVVRFERPGAYQPLISGFSEESERNSMASGSIFACWGGIVAWTVAVFLVATLFHVHRILPYLAIIVVVVSFSLVGFGLTMMKSDLKAAHDRVERVKTSALDALDQIFSARQITWDRKWSTLRELNTPRFAALSDSDRSRARRISIDVARSAVRTSAIRNRFPERLLAPLWGVPDEPIPELPEDFTTEIQRLDSKFVPTRVEPWEALVSGGIASVVAVIAFVLGFRYIRQKRYIENVPTSLTKGVVYGMAEVAGQVVLPVGTAPIVGPVSMRDCVQYTYKVEEKRQSGNKTNWVTIESRAEDIPFLCQDDEGVIPVVPSGAEIFTSHSTVTTEGKLRYSETRLEVADPVYVLASAEVDPEQQDRLRLAKGEGGLPFFITNKGERSLMLRKAWWGFSGLTLGLGGGILPVLMGFGAAGSFAATDYLLAALTAPAYLAAIAIMLMYNDIVFLYQRVQRAWSNIDVSLKKRFDLLINLERVAKSYLEHERSLQSSLARLRQQFNNAIDRDPATASQLLIAEQAVHQGLIGLQERYPQLKADTIMGQLMKKLTGLEDEVALMRQGYNDSVELYNSRIAQFPDLFLAKVFGFREAPLFQTREQEREQIDLRHEFNPDQEETT